MISVPMPRPRSSGRTSRCPSSGTPGRYRRTSASSAGSSHRYTPPTGRPSSSATSSMPRPESWRANRSAKYRSWPSAAIRGARSAHEATRTSTGDIRRHPVMENLAGYLVPLPEAGQADPVLVSGEPQLVERLVHGQAGRQLGEAPAPPGVVRELLTTGPLRIGERIVGLLVRRPELGDRAQPDVVEEEQPVLVVDLGKERLDPVHPDGERTAADERVLAPAGLAVCVADDGVVRVPPDGKPDGVVAVEEGDRPPEIRRILHDDVVVEEDHPLPADRLGQQQPEVALEAGVRAPFESGTGELPGGLEARHRVAEFGRHVHGDQVDQRVPLADVVDDVPDAGPAAAQHDQRAAQLGGEPGDVAQIRRATGARHDDRVDPGAADLGWVRPGGQVAVGLAV